MPTTNPAQIPAIVIVLRQMLQQAEAKPAYAKVHPLLRDGVRVRGFLKDLLPNESLLHHVLSVCVQEGIVAEMSNPPAHIQAEDLWRRWCKSLHDKYGTEWALIEFALQCWVGAVGFRVDASWLGKSNAQPTHDILKSNSHLQSNINIWQPLNSRYNASQDGLMIQDRKTGLIWEREKSVDGMTHNEAVSHARSCCAGGFKDWRLPTVQELHTLFIRNDAWKQAGINGSFTKIPDQQNKNDKSPWIDLQAFPNGNTWYWSSTKVQKNDAAAWVVRFDGGDDYYYAVSNHCYARAVRGPVS